MTGIIKYQLIVILIIIYIFIIFIFKGVSLKSGRGMGGN